VSPLPHIHNSISPANPSHNADKSSKVSALLDSVVDSIQPSLAEASAVSENEGPVSQGENSPITRRNRDLAQALFGIQGDRKSPPAKLSLSRSGTMPSVVVDSDPAGNSSTPEFVHHQQRNPSRPNTLPTPVNQADLAREVQRRADAAMVALRRTPTQPKSELSPAGGSISRRRVSPGQISNPRLVSSSTSVDTIPLRSPSVASANTQTSTIGQRFKRLRGTLRTKAPTPTGEEVTPYPLDIHTPPSSQTAYYDPSSLRVPGEPAILSATEVGRPKVPIPSPPASAGPGLKRFISRFRKPRTLDSHPEQEPYGSPQITPDTNQFSSSIRHDRIDSFPLQPLPALANYQMPKPPHYPLSPPSPPITVENTNTPIHEMTGANGVDDDDALRQLYEAAVNLGLDHATVTDILARSSSTRSPARATLSQDASSARSPRPDTQDSSARERIHSPLLPDDRPSDDPPSFPLDDSSTRKLSIRKGPDHLRRPRNGQDDGMTAASNAIVRRTIIFPSESRTSTIDLNALARKHSQSRHRRSGSVASISSRSVHDRVPTPPPPRSPIGQMFQTGVSPPVPQLPPSFSSRSDNLLPPHSAPAGPIEKSSSAYDSL
jgi:serine/arginine repetitive matrix protein 2